MTMAPLLSTVITTVSHVYHDKYFVDSVQLIIKTLVSVDMLLPVSTCIHVFCPDGVFGLKLHHASSTVHRIVDSKIYFLLMYCIRFIWNM